MAEPEMYQLNEAARLLGVSRTALYAMAGRGEAAFVRLGGRTLMRRTEVERIAASAQDWKPDPTRAAEANAARRKIPVRALNLEGQKDG